MTEIEDIVADCPTSERTYGYTSVDDGSMYFWEWDGNRVSFRDDNGSKPPVGVKHETRQWVRENQPF